MNTFPIIARTVVLAVVFCAMALAPSYAADRTISTNYVLSADETVDGVLTVGSGRMETRIAPIPSTTRQRTVVRLCHL